LPSFYYLFAQKEKRLFVACYLLLVACYLFLVACYLLFVFAVDWCVILFLFLFLFFASGKYFIVARKNTAVALQTFFCVIL
jgi:hypothetical protein